MNLPKISVIISTYNQPAWLQKVIWAYTCQTYLNFEVLIADDGSTEETTALIKQLNAEVDFSIKHIWHEDRGFRKTVILNKAILAAEADYLVFTDGDCIPRADFLAIHIRFRKQGYFLSGGYFKLPQSISELINKHHIVEQSCFKSKWLLDQGISYSFKLNKLCSSSFKAKLLNLITPTKATWNGMNASGWRKDVIDVNGFDERMQYGGEDRELGERLFNAGIKARQIRYSAICLHLYHERGYVTPEMIELNKAIRKITKQKRLTQTNFGIKKLS